MNTRTTIPAEEIRFVVDTSSLGLVLAAWSDRGLCAVLLGDDRSTLGRELQDCFPGARLADGDTELRTLVTQVIEFVDDPSRGLDIPLDLRGTKFQRSVWGALREIPAGSTASYTDIAHRLGLPNAVRAVARACATNILAVVIPCHRIVKKDGSLSGYRWGIDRKRILLAREAAACALTQPKFPQRV